LFLVFLERERERKREVKDGGGEETKALEASLLVLFDNHSFFWGAKLKLHIGTSHLDFKYCKVLLIKMHQLSV